MFTFRKWFLEKGLCRAAKTPRRKPINSKVRLESLEERVNPAPTVVTDLLDYAPGSTALITANNFKVGSEVVFQVSHMISAGVDGTWGTPDDVVDTEKNAMSSDHQPWAVTDGVWWRVNAGADNIEGTSDDVIAGDLDKCENGSIETSWFVNPDDSVGATFALTATGLDPDSVKITAMSMFTDAIKTDFRGWENVESAGVDWANGGINAGQGLYLEGDYIPHAVNFSGLTVGSDYTFNISFNYFQASSNSGGFVDIGTYNQSVAPTLVFPVGSGSPLSDATTMPDSGGVFYISTYGGTIDADVTNVTQSLAISTTEKQSTVTFKALDTSATFYYGLRLAVPGEVLVPAGVTPNTNPTNGADGFTGLSLQSSVKNGPDGPAIGGGGNVQVAPGAVVQGSISGVKWSDLNGNGIKESNEPGLAGWTIQIYKDADGDKVFGVGDTLINSTTTADGKTDANKDGKIDANDLGYYNFAALRGTYFVREVQQVGWTQTFPNNNIHGPLNINETTPQYVNQNFGNMRDKPTIDITKEHTGIVNEGTIDQVLVYTFTVTNTSAVTTGSETITSLTDTILGDLFAAFKAANGGSAVIAAGATVSFTVNYTAPVANAFVSIANIVTVVGNDDQGNFVTDSASDIEFYKDLQPAITIVKTPDPTSVLEGGIGNQMVTYTYLLTNTSMAGAFDPLSNINVSDTDGVPVYVSGDDGDNLLEKGETWIYTLTVAMPIQDAFTVHENTVTATGKDDENNSATGMATAKVTYTDYVPTSIKINKSHTGTIDEGTGGQTLVYTYTVFDDETVPTDPTKVTSILDNIIGDILSYFIAANGGSDILQPGGSITFDVAYTPVPLANAKVELTNVVLVVGEDNEGNVTTDSATDTVVYLDLLPAIDITKSHTGTINEGTSDQVLVYSFTVSNMSTASTDPLTVSSLSDSVLGNLLPAFLAANGDSAVIPFGGSVTFTVDYTAPVANAGVVIANTVVVIGQDDEQNPVEDSASDEATYQDVKPMIDIMKSHTGTINEGTSDQVLVYSFTVSNMSTASTDPLTVSSLSDSVLGNLLPAFLAANSDSAVIPFGGSVTFTVDYTAPVANAGVVIANTVVVIGQDDEQNPVEDSASDEVAYQDVKPMIDIMKSHTGTINEGTSGQVLTYSFTVMNMSTATTDPLTVSSLSDSVLGNLLPAFLAANGDSAVIPFGGSVTFTVNYTAPVANAGVVIANTVVVIGQDDEQNPVEDSASDEVAYQDVKPMIDIMKSHTGTINEGESGQVLTYSFTVTNTSTATTDPVTVSSLSDTVLGDLLGAFKAANGGSAVLPFGGSVTFTVDYTAPVANAGVVIANTVVVIGQDDEQNPVEDSASDEATYQDVKPMIDITKSHTGTINEGTSDQVLVYSFTVSNMSTASTDPVTVSSLSDSVLGDLLAALKAANGGSAVIPFSGSVTFTVDYTAPVANAGVVIANTVVVIGQDDEQNPVEDSASDAETYKNLNPSITVTKTPDKTEVVLGSTVTYTYYLTNTSIAGAFDPLSGITLVDTDGAPSYVSGDSNINSILEVGETWKYVLTYTTTSYGVHNNTVTASGKDDENISTVGYASAAINVTGQQANGKTLGYYSNKNGQKDLTGSPKGTTLLSSIYNNLFAPNTGLLAKDSVYSVLVDGSGNYKPLSFFSSYANIRSYLLGATATNMAYMLSVQLLTTEFNIQFGRISALKSILASAVAMPMASQNSLSSNNGANSWMQVSYSGVANIQTILDAAISSLKASPNTISSGPDRVYQEGLKCLLDAMNNNQSIFLP